MIATYDTFSVDRICLLLQVLIRAGIVFRVVFCLVKLMLADEENSQYKKRIRNALVFAVIAELIFSVKNLIIGYFS
jgi:hypothetical protein